MWPAISRFARRLGSRFGRWAAHRMVTWPRRRRSMWLMLMVFLAGGIVSARLDGFAVADLPFGPQMADGIGLAAAPDLIAAPELPVTAEVYFTFPVPKQRPEPAGEPPLPSPLIIATEGGYPPFNFVDETGALRGLEVDFIYEVCATLRLTCKVVQRDWDRLMPGLEAGDYHVVAASLRIPDTAPSGIAFSNAYFRSAAAYATRRDDEDARVTGPIGVEAGSRMAAYLAQREDTPEVRVYDDPITTYQALADGEVNAIFDDAVRLNRWLNDPSAMCCTMAGAAVFAPAYFGPGVGFAVRESDAELLAALNEAILELSKDGKIAELSERYLPFALN